MIQTFELPFAAKQDRKYFKVICEGPCIGVKITLHHAIGDPDLYGLESEIPCTNPTTTCTCSDCSSFCQSISTSHTDVCDNINTISNTFYITVYAYDDYDDSTIAFENVAIVEETSANYGSGKMKQHKILLFKQCLNHILDI